MKKTIAMLCTALFAAVALADTWTDPETSMVTNVVAGVEPLWSRKITVEYDGLGGADASNKIVRVYYLSDGEWQRIPASLISGGLSVATGHHTVEIDADGCGFEPGEVMLKLCVVEKSKDGIDIENDDGWTEEDATTWRSRRIGDDEETSLYATVEGMGEFVFSWKASSESVSWDWLECFVDGESAGKIGGETDWEEFVVELPDDGVHEITWTYRKDSSVSSGQDCGWVDLSSAGMTEVIVETPVTVTIPEPTMELDAEMSEDGAIKLVPEVKSATIYYTLDGSVPTVDSAIYAGPMAWSDFKTMRAVALTDDGEWSEVLIGSEYVRISFDPALGTMTNTAPILRKIGEPIGTLPEVERGNYGFNGWTTYIYDSEGWIDEDTEVESWWTKLYATWDIEAEEVLDPTGDLGLIEFNDDYERWIGRERNPLREYVRISGEIESQTTSTVVAVEFAGVGVLSFERLYTWHDGVSYLLDGEPCTVANKQLKVFSGGEHRFEIVITYNDADGWSCDGTWSYFDIYVGAMTWTPCDKSSHTVTFDANDGSVWPKSKTFAVNNAYGSLPKPTRSGFSFDGWYTSVRGGVHVTESDYVDFTADTLYAHWRGSVADYMGDEVSNVTVGNEDIYSDGAGVVFPIPNCDYKDVAWYWLLELQGWTNNYVEVLCDGEATISFDWVFDAVSHGTDVYWFANTQHRFTIDGMEVPSLESDCDNQSASVFYNSNPRTSVKAFLTPGTHVLRWEVLSGYTYGADVYCAVENFRIDEKPVANRESLFDWCKLGVDYLVWKPGNLEYLANKYTQRINANANDYEAYIWRALTKIALLGENQTAREIIGRCGYSIADYNFMPNGEFVGLENAPLSNDVIDEFTPEILAALDSALADMKAIPENWSGRIKINPEDFGFTVKENEYWDVGNLYYGLAEVSLIRAGIEAARAAVKLARGYDYGADYIAVSNAAINAHKNGASHIYEFKDVLPKVASIRNWTDLLEAKEDFRAALLSIRRADLSIESRSECASAMDRYDEYLVEYDLEAMEEVTEYRKIYNSILASLDATNAVDITWFVNKYDTNDIVRANAPGGMLSRKLFLGALFAGTITRYLVPDVFLKPVVSVDMDTVDLTVGGLLPDVTMSEVLRDCAFSQTWSIEEYANANISRLRLVPNQTTLTLTGAVEDSGIVKLDIVESGTLTFSVDGVKKFDRLIAQGTSVSFYVSRGQTYRISFTPCGDVPQEIAPIVVVSYPKEIKRHVVRFNANRGVCAQTSVKVKSGQSIGALPAATRSEYDFLGWFTAIKGGEQVSSNTVVTADVTLYAHWERIRETVVEEIVSIAVDEETTFVATTYNGYLCREADGVVVGTVQVKAAKAKVNKKTGKTTSKLTISVQMAGSTKKVSISGEYDLTTGGEQTFTPRSGSPIKLLLGTNGLTGSYGDYVIEAVPNVFTAKDATSKAAANAANEKYVGVYNLVADEGTFTVSVMKKGKVKVTGTTTAGKSVSVSTQLIVGSDVACVPVMAPKYDLAFTVWFGDEISVDGLTDGVIGKAGNIAATSTFSLDVASVASALKSVATSVFTDYLPNDATIANTGKKWIVMPDANGKAAKAGKIVLAKDGTVDTAKSKIDCYNVAALKLTYTAKTGAFKGSFYVYTLKGTKLKKLTAKVAGIVVDGVGYGTATIKGADTIPVVIK